MQIMALAAQKGGVGETTLAGHLAAQAVRQGTNPVALVDADPQAHGEPYRGLTLSLELAKSGPDSGRFYRLQAGPLSSKAAAKRLCRRAKRRRLDRMVVRP